MGLFKGSVSYRRYRLLGDLPKDHPPVFLASVQKHAFQPIEGQNDLERAAGWVSLSDPLDTTFTGEKLFFDDQMLFALRIDTKRVPAKVLAAYVQKAEREYLEKKGGDGLTRREKRDIRELVRLQLLGRVVPSLATYDVHVDLTEREVRFWSLTKSVCEEFQELFENTFGLNLLPMGVWGMASKLLAAAELDRFDGIAPAVFARPR